MRATPQDLVLVAAPASITGVVVLHAEERALEMPPKTPSPLETALECCRRRWSPIPIAYGAEQPEIEGWQTLNITEHDAPLYFGTEPKNLGVIAGSRSMRLSIVLPQCEVAGRITSHLMPYTGAVLTSAGVTSAYLYDAVHLPRSRPFTFSDVGESGLEIPIIKLVGDGLPDELVLFPPSMTTSGQAIDWNLGTISRVDPLDLTRACGKVAAYCILARRWKEPKIAASARPALMALLLANGWSVADIVKAVLLIAINSDQEIDILRWREEAARLMPDTGGRAKHWFGQLARVIGDDVAALVARYLWLAGAPRREPIPEDDYEAEIAATRPRGDDGFTRPAALADEPVAEREWFVPDVIPSSTVTLLGGDGGTGKSLLAMQLAVASATGRTWLGMDVKEGGAIYVSAEDDLDELRRRLASIAAAETIQVADIKKLNLLPLFGEDALLAVVDREAGLLKTTTLFARLEERIAKERPALVVLDTLADLFGGDENNRAHARQFIGILNGLAARFHCVVLVLAHPSVAGMERGRGYSGTTGWNNSVRSRMYLQMVADDKPNSRRLVLMKANYGPSGASFSLVWRDGVFVTEARVAADGPERAAASDKAKRVFIKLLRIYTENGRDVNEASGKTYAPLSFSRDPGAEGVTKRAFQAAMDDLFTEGRLRVEKFGPPSKPRKRIVEVPLA
jgi:RecA-family ATPase